MGKYILVFFIAVIICGAIWFAFGRGTTSELARIVNRIDGELKVASGNISSFGMDLDQYTTGVSDGVTEAVGINNELSELQTRFWNSTEQFSDEIGSIHSATVSIADGVNTVESGLSDSLKVSRDISDLAYYARRRAEKDEETQ